MATNDEILGQLYASEISFKMNTDWDAGYFASLGSPYTNLWGQQVYGRTLTEVIDNLSNQAVVQYPDSQFAFWVKNGTIEGYVPCEVKG